MNQFGNMSIAINQRFENVEYQEISRCHDKMIKVYKISVLR